MIISPMVGPQTTQVTKEGRARGSRTIRRGCRKLLPAAMDLGVNEQVVHRCAACEQHRGDD